MENARPALTFLDLPEEARRSIYAMAGLSRPCPIDLLARDPRSDTRPPGSGSCNPCWYLRRRRGGWGECRPGTPLCACPRLPLELLRVSRRVGDEALNVLMRTNRFIVRARAGCAEMLAPLAVHIPEAHLARITSLVVRLNCWPCPWGHDETRARPRRAPNRCCLCSENASAADPALSSSCSAGLDMLDAWELVCARLGSGMSPRQLDLTLICDIDPTDDGSAASRLLDPLRCYLPLLRSCTLRLGRTSKEQNLARLARKTALALVGIETEEPSKNSKSFPFDRLPWELKIRILSYTHLGPSGLAGYDLGLERPDIVNGRVILQRKRSSISYDYRKCCDRCTGTFLDWFVACPVPYFSLQVSTSPYLSFPVLTQTIKSCCSITYAAFSPTCTCRSLPTALFYVSRAMRRAAMEIFYKHADLRVRHHDLGAILRIFPPATLPLLRRLTIYLTPAQCYYWFGRAPDFAHPDWHLRSIVNSELDRPEELREDQSVQPGMLRECADHYRPNLRAALARLAAEGDLARLELDLDLHAAWWFSKLFEGDSEPDEEDRFRWTYELYIDVAEIVCAELPGLRGVRFHLATYSDLEKWLEREVLGERFLGSVESPKGRRRGLSQAFPSYHRMNQRIRGSHYHGDMETGDQR